MKKIDVLISQLNDLTFLKDHSTHFTVDEARAVIRIIFPKRMKTVSRMCGTSYGMKHQMERISRFVKRVYSCKYCSNGTLKEAMIAEGFIGAPADRDGLNLYFNISKEDDRRIETILKKYPIGIPSGI